MILRCERESPKEKCCIFIQKLAWHTVFTLLLKMFTQARSAQESKFVIGFVCEAMLFHAAKHFVPFLFKCISVTCDSISSIYFFKKVNNCNYHTQSSFSANELSRRVFGNFLAGRTLFCRSELLKIRIWTDERSISLAQRIRRSSVLAFHREQNLRKRKPRYLSKSDSFEHQEILLHPLQQSHTHTANTATSEKLSRPRKNMIRRIYHTTFVVFHDCI